MKNNRTLLPFWVNISIFYNKSQWHILIQQLGVLFGKMALAHHPLIWLSQEQGDNLILSFRRVSIKNETVLKALNASLLCFLRENPSSQPSNIPSQASLFANYPNNSLQFSFSERLNILHISSKTDRFFREWCSKLAIFFFSENEIDNSSKLLFAVFCHTHLYLTFFMPGKKMPQIKRVLDKSGTERATSQSLSFSQKKEYIRFYYDNCECFTETVQLARKLIFSEPKLLFSQSVLKAKNMSYLYACRQLNAVLKVHFLFSNDILVFTVFKQLIAAGKRELLHA